MAVTDIGMLLAKDAELLQRKHLMHLTNALSDQVCPSATALCSCGPRLSAQQHPCWLRRQVLFKTTPYHRRLQDIWTSAVPFHEAASQSR